MIGSVNPQVKTPVLDALARNGVRFEHMISNAPVCTPYRGILLSGQHPLYNGCISSDVPLHRSIGLMKSDEKFRKADLPQPRQEAA